jgi:hypothetical protein
MLSARVPGLDGIDSTLRLHSALCEASAPDYCALLTALNIDFNTATLGFVKMTSSTSSAEIWTQVSVESLSVESARCEVTARVANRRRWKKLASYWYLRIYDPKWLKEQFPRAILRPFLSIAEDRKKILGILKSTSLLPLARTHKISKSLSGIRAKLRDQEWLRDKLDEQRERIRKEEARSEHLRDIRVASIEEALQRLLRGEGRAPRKIGPAVLTRESGLSHSQIERVIRSSPHLTSLILAANADRRRQVLVWGARQLQAEGHPLSVSSICKRAGINHSKGAGLARAIIAELES